MEFLWYATIFYYEEAKSVVESHFLQTFGFIGPYKIIELTYEELLDFEIF